MATSRWRVPPNFVVIGGQRCGTTSLYEALSRHRDIVPSFRKEVHFFDLHHHRGDAWYLANFPRRARLRGRITGEATPNYLAYPDAPRLMHDALPDVRLIALLRNPVTRAHSAWKLRTYEGDESRSFEQAVKDEMAGVAPDLDGVAAARRQRWRQAMRFAYLEKSRYGDHLDRWLQSFAPPRILVMQSEKLFAEPAAGLRRIQDFLEIAVDPTLELPKTNFTAASTVPAALTEQLNEYFAPQVLRLQELLGQSFDW